MSDGCDLVLKNVLLPGGRVADISLFGGRVVHVGAGLTRDDVLNCRGKTVLPAAVDMHVHMRGGVQSHKEDWESGSRSALAGGVTVVVDQPNTIPPLVTPDSFTRRVREAEGASFCHYAVNAGYVSGCDIQELWSGGAMAFGELFAAPSSYGDALKTEDLSTALRTVSSFGGLCTIHAEEVRDGQDSDLHAHNALRSPHGESRAVQWIRNLNTRSCRLHLCHMSSQMSITSAGDSTVEVTPHHLLLSVGDFDPLDARGKVNPPLRPSDQRRKLIMTWDRIDVLASDHAPHTLDEKELPFESAPSGVPGVETMVPLMLQFCRERKIPMTSLMEKTSWKPAAILGIPRAGFLAGDRADFAIYGSAETVIRGDLLHSRAGWTPFEGRKAVFPDTVIMGGKVVFHEGSFSRGNPSWIPGRGYIGPAPIKNGADTAQP